MNVLETSLSTFKAKATKLSNQLRETELTLREKINNLKKINHENVS